MTPALSPGTPVRVRDAFPPGHVRTPAYVRGCRGVIHADLGPFPNAEEMAYGRTAGEAIPLYRVRFDMRDVWGEAGASPDALILDLHAHWLEPVDDVS